MSEKIGLALSGGAAFGFAHLPVLQAFDELGVKPYAMSGTSMGAVAAACYAAGYSAQELAEHAGSVFTLRSALLHHIPRILPGHFRTSLKDWNPWNFDPLHVLHEFLPDLPETFADLSIETTIVATNFDTGKPAVFHDGLLIPAVAASISIPGIFKPLMIENQAHYDGGLVCPLPTEYLPEDCSSLIAVCVTSGLEGLEGEGSGVCHKTRVRPQPLKAHNGTTNRSMGDLMLGSVKIVSNQLSRLSLLRRPADLLLYADIDGVGPGDFLKSQNIIQKNAQLTEQTKRFLDATLTAAA